MTITDTAPCANCGCPFSRHHGWHDFSLGGCGSWIDAGCECGCEEFEVEEIN